MLAAHARTCTHTHTHTHARAHTRTHARTHTHARARALSPSPLTSAPTRCARPQGDNAWVFVHEDDIADAVKYFNGFVAVLEKEAKAAAPKGVEVRAGKGAA